MQVRRDIYLEKFLGAMVEHYKWLIIDNCIKGLPIEVYYLSPHGREAFSKI